MITKLLTLSLILVTNLTAAQAIKPDEVIKDLITYEQKSPGFLCIPPGYQATHSCLIIHKDGKTIGVIIDQDRNFVEFRDEQGKRLWHKSWWRT